jgi:hypothetical protein
MIRNSMTRMLGNLFRGRNFRGGQTAAVFAVLFIVALHVPACGADSEPGHAGATRPVSVKEAPAVSAVNSGTPAAKAAETASGTPATPSLKQVIELLQEQGQEIASLRAALSDQQALTARLEAKLNAAGPEMVATQPALPAAIGNGAAVGTPKPAQLESGLGNFQRSFEERLKNFGPFSFSGDLRLRAEPTFGGPADRSQDRFRERVRFRFNAEAKLNDQLRGGFSLASGDLNNPTSTNQTLNQYATRKPIAIDKMYATYTPSWFKPLTLTGGKFAYPWFNTELVWDKDLNPEGAGETLAFNVKTPLLKKISVVGFQLPFAENKRTAATNKSYYNTMVYGEQLQTFWQLGDRVRLSAYGSFYDWKFADSVALSLLTANSASPDDALLALNSNGQQNSIATVTLTNPLTGAKTISSAQYASKFGIVDALAQLDIAMPSQRWPLTFIGDFAENTRACENVKNFAVGAVLSAPCDPHARKGYWLETSVGRTVKKGDWQFSYTRIVVQREAVIGAFNYSEIFPTNNVEIHRPEILYQLFDNVTLQLNGLFGRPLVTAGSPAPQPLWERLQFDMTYKF